MAVNIFDQYGLKEVSNVCFEALGADETMDVEKGDIVLYIDTAKVSTIETTAENVSARGGWGNPELVTWDYNREITVNLEDALMSFQSLQLMLGGKIKKAAENEVIKVRMTKEFVVATENTVPELYEGEGANKVAITLPATYKWINLTAGTRGQVAGEDASIVAAAGDQVRVFYDVEKKQEGEAVQFTISPDTFPGSYKVYGDSKIRSRKTGKDELTLNSSLVA